MSEPDEPATEKSPSAEKSPSVGKSPSAEKSPSCAVRHSTGGDYSSFERHAIYGSAEMDGTGSPGSPGMKKRVQGGIGSNFIRTKQSDDSWSDHSSFGSRARALLQRCMFGPRFANFMALVVVFDAYSTCMDIDARAQGVEANPILMLASDLCLILYTVELLLLVSLKGCRVLASDWLVLVDTLIVCCGYAEILTNSLMNSQVLADLGIMRVLRLARMIRLVRLLRKTRGLRELQKLVTMMATCLKTLAWSFLFCFIIMTVWAMLMVEMVNPLIHTMNKETGIFDDCEECLRATGSVMHANLLLFKTVIAGDSWGLIAVPVIEEYPATAIIFIGSLLSLVFGVLNLIVAVVVDTFAEARDRDVLNLAEEMERNHENDKKFLQKVFDRIDEDGSGELTLEELVEGARKDQEFQSRLRVMDIDEEDLQQLFEMIDADGSGAIEAPEFIAPLSRWVHDSKTAPRFIKYNMLRTMQQQEDIFRQSQIQFSWLKEQLDQVQSALSSMAGGAPKDRPPSYMDGTAELTLELPSMELRREPGWEQEEVSPALSAFGPVGSPQDSEQLGFPRVRQPRPSNCSAMTEPLETVDEHLDVLPDIAEELEQPASPQESSVRADWSKLPLPSAGIVRPRPSPRSTWLHVGEHPPEEGSLKMALESLEQSLLISTEGALRRSMGLVEAALQQKLGQLASTGAPTSPSFSGTGPAKYTSRRASVFNAGFESPPPEKQSRKGSFEGWSPGLSELGTNSRSASSSLTGRSSEVLRRPGIPSSALRNTAPEPENRGREAGDESAGRTRSASEFVLSSRRAARSSLAGLKIAMGVPS